MQQIKRFLFGLFLCVVFLPCVYAKCSTEEKAELNSLASNVKANYEEAQREMDKSEYSVPESLIGTEEEETFVAYEDYFKINIMNITDKIRVEVSNNYDSSKEYFNSSNTTDGVGTFDWNHLDKVTIFTVKVYADGDNKCTTDALRTLRIRTPRYNYYYSYDLCNAAKELDVCQKYVTFNDLDYNTFILKVEQYIAENEKPLFGNKAKTEKRNKIILGGVLAAAVIGVATVVIVMKKRSKEI